MSQQPIDLLPASIRTQCEAGARTGRLIMAVVAGVVLVIIFATQSRFQLDRARDRHEVAREEAEAVMETERQANALAEQVREIRTFIERYESLSLPLNTSDIMATIINELPDSVTLERLELETGRLRPARTTSRSGVESTRVPRVLVGDITGFAASDDDIAELARRLQRQPAIQHVTQDFSRTRTIRDIVAREFRLSFRIDLDHRFEVMTAAPMARLEDRQ